MKKSVILSVLLGVIIGMTVTKKVDRKDTKRLKDLSNKHLSLFLMMNQWVKVKQEGKSLDAYFEGKGIKKIAIYGMSYAGETLLAELRESSVEVAYGIDKKSNSLYADIDIISMDNEMDEVDAVVVTAITFFDEIEEKLQQKINCPIISLEEILYEI